MTNTSERIISYIKLNKQGRAHELSRALQVSRVIIHRHLKKLVESGELKKVGKPPLVFYVLNENKESVKNDGIAQLSSHIQEYININYLYIAPQGEMLYGTRGFEAWVKSIKEESRITTIADEYVKTHRSSEKIRSREGWIDATEKLRGTFPDLAIEKLFYGDFYSIPKFGKTKLGNLVLYSKQSQNRELIALAIKLVRPIIEKIITEYKIDTIAFIPASVPRNIQFMQEFANELHINLPKIQLVKSYTGDILVAQKSLSGLGERIMNARETIFAKTLMPINAQNILIIDDAVGSGATLNETAKKLQPANLNKKMIFGFAIVGSIKGFEVIREV